MTANLVVITGASSGIGEAFARRLAPAHDLLLVARRRDRLEALASELHQRYGTNAEVLVADLTNPADLNRVAERLETDPALVLLVNNAGFGTRGFFWEAPYQNHEQMHQLHVMATLRLMHAALRNLVARDTGAIINVSSVSAYVRMAGTTCYAATKSWMNVFTEGIHLELQAAASRVAVQALCPGFTYSEFRNAMRLRSPGAGEHEFKQEGGGFWMTADYVVEASLDGLRRRQLFVVPNWRYRVLTALLSKLPAAVRLGVERRLSSRQPASRSIDAGRKEVEDRR